MKINYIKNIFLLLSIGAMASCSTGPNTNNDVVPDNTKEITSRADANYQGMIVGSSGHFFALINEKIKKLSVVLDKKKMEFTLSSEADENHGKVYTFETADKKNKIVILVSSTGDVSVKETVLDGHPGAIAEITTVDDTKPDTEKPLMFEGTRTMFAVKKVEGSHEEVTPTADNKIELFSLHFNMIIKGDKLLVLQKMNLPSSEVERLKKIWEAKNIEVDQHIIDSFSRGGAGKLEFRITSRTASKIEATPMVDEHNQGKIKDIVIHITTENDKLKLTLDVEDAKNPNIPKDKLKAKVDGFRELVHHTHGKYYEFLSAEKKKKYEELKVKAVENGVSEALLAKVTAFIENLENVKEITEEQAKTKVYPYLDAKYFYETTITEVK